MCVVGVGQACAQISRLLVASAELLAAMRAGLGGGTGKGKNRPPGGIDTVTPNARPGGSENR